MKKILKYLFRAPSAGSIDKYSLVSVLNNFEATGSVYVQVQVKGKTQTFIKSAKELYKKEWIQDFSKEDAAYLGVLVASEKSKDYDLVKAFPGNKPESSFVVIMFAVIFSALLIATNVGSIKLSEFSLGFLGTYNFPSTVIFFPLLYLVTDVVTEVYGFKFCRKMIWGAVGGLTLFVGLINVSILLPAASEWKDQGEYQLILGSTFRIFIASSCAFLLGDLVNSFILSRLRRLTTGRFFALRALGSTFFGASIDSIIFVSIAYFGKFSSEVLYNIIFTETFVKVLIEMLVIPFGYMLVNLLRRTGTKEGYDGKSDLNPFSIS